MPLRLFSIRLLTADATAAVTTIMTMAMKSSGR